MDLSFSRFDPERGESAPVAMPVELAVLLVGVASRQSASTTARAQSVLNGMGRMPVPASGAFCTATAAALRGWTGE